MSSGLSAEPVGHYILSSAAYIRSHGLGADFSPLSCYTATRPLTAVLARCQVARGSVPTLVDGPTSINYARVSACGEITVRAHTRRASGRFSVKIKQHSASLQVTDQYTLSVHTLGTCGAPLCVRAPGRHAPTNCRNARTASWRFRGGTLRVRERSIDWLI